MDLYTYYLYNDRIKFEENLDLKVSDWILVFP